MNYLDELIIKHLILDELAFETPRGMIKYGDYFIKYKRNFKHITGSVKNSKGDIWAIDGVFPRELHLKELQKKCH